jgi:hypothetical protein
MVKGADPMPGTGLLLMIHANISIKIVEFVRAQEKLSRSIHAGTPGIGGE